MDGSLSILRPWQKTSIVVFFDIFCIVISYLAAHMLRFNSLFPPIFRERSFPITILLMIIAQLGSLYVCGAYKAIFRFSSLPDLIRITKGLSLGIPVSVLFIFITNRLEEFPRSVFIIDAMLLLILSGAGRFAYRIFQYNWRNRHLKSNPSIDHAVIIGAGVAGEKLLRDIKSSPELNIKVVAIVDDDYWKKGKLLHGVKVMGDIQDLPSVIERTNAKKAYLAIPSASSSTVRRVIDSCSGFSVELKILPAFKDILDRVDYSQLRAIEPVDLLGREQIDLDTKEIEALLQGKRVIITGAGGSIGSELCFQVAKYKPKMIIALENTELFLYELERKIAKTYPNIPIIPVIGDVRNLEKVHKTFEVYSPEIVFHAAAYKHVPMMEVNPIESILTNIGGTKNVAEAAIAHCSEKFVLISTDKAINPTNIMGTTKRRAEIVCQSLQKNSTVRFSTIRFGNVLGSSGSVVPLFKEQIENGGPVTITHPDVERYFMSIPEACQLVLQAGSFGKGGEIFVLDMGYPVKISDLAKEMITLAGFIPNQDIEIKYIGLRPGEKLYEELFSEKEKLTGTPHKKVKVAKVRDQDISFEEDLKRLLETPYDESPENITKSLRRIVPEFAPAPIQPIETLD